MVQPASLVKFFPECIEERVTEHGRNSAADHDLGDIEHCRHCRTCPCDHDPCPFDNRRRCSPQFSIGAGVDPPSTGVHRQAADRTAPAFEPIRFDQDVAELPEVSGQAL